MDAGELETTNAMLHADQVLGATDEAVEIALFRVAQQALAERVEAPGGRLAIRTRRHGGTEVEARLPGPPPTHGRRA